MDVPSYIIAGGRGVATIWINGRYSYSNWGKYQPSYWMEKEGQLYWRHYDDVDWHLLERHSPGPNFLVRAIETVIAEYALLVKDD